SELAFVRGDFDSAQAEAEMALIGSSTTERIHVLIRLADIALYLGDFSVARRVFPAPPWPCRITILVRPVRMSVWSSGASQKSRSASSSGRWLNGTVLNRAHNERSGPRSSSGSCFQAGST